MTWSRQRSADYGWLKPVLDAASDGVLIESDERVTYVNRSYAELLGYDRPDHLLDQRVDDFIATADREKLLRFGRLRLLGQHAPATYDFLARGHDGSEIRLQASVSVAVVGITPCIATFVRPFYSSTAELAGSATEVAGPHGQLSPREREVMNRILEGKRIKEIASELMVSAKTVATHRARLLTKIGITGNRELFQYALRHRLIEWN